MVSEEVARVLPAIALRWCRRKRSPALQQAEFPKELRTLSKTATITCLIDGRSAALKDCASCLAKQLCDAHRRAHPLASATEPSFHSELKHGRPLYNQEVL
ncbi:hypothetical protein ABPG77_008251 [Micractinium sp. CCAP 211/92]